MSSSVGRSKAVHEDKTSGRFGTNLRRNVGRIECAARSTLKKGILGGIKLAFESIVEEVRRFVARMPPADYSAGSACYLRNFSALGDQRAEIFPVQRPRTLSLSARRMMRLTRKPIFPYFSLSITDQLPPTSRGFPQCPEKLFLETRKGYTPLTGQST